MHLHVVGKHMQYEQQGAASRSDQHHAALCDELWRHGHWCQTHGVHHQEPKDQVAAVNASACTRNWTLSVPAGADLRSATAHVGSAAGGHVLIFRA